MAPIVAQIDAAAIPEGVKQRTVPRFRYDTDPEAPAVLDGYDYPQATYCYAFETDHGTMYFLNADQSAAAWKALEPRTEGEDLGPVVGHFFKCDPRDGSLKWAGAEGARFDVHQAQLDRLAVACTLVGGVD